MSLEAAIRELNDNVLTLTKALVEYGRPSTPPAPKAEPAPTKPVTGKAEAPKALDYEKDVKPLALKLVAKDKPKYQEILKKYGVPGGPALKSEQLAGALVDIQAALK